MRTVNRFFLSAISTMVAGCATAPLPTHEYSKLAQRVSLDSSPADSKGRAQDPNATPQQTPLAQDASTVAERIGLQDPEFLKLLEIEVNSCQEQAQKYREEFDKNRTTTKWVAGVGILAGSIVVPALAAASAGAAIVAGFGGVAGAANAYQLTLNSQGESPTAAAAAYRTFTDEVQKRAGEQLKGIKTGEAAAAHLLSLRAYCAFPPLPTTEEVKNHIPNSVSLATERAAEAEQLAKVERSMAEAAELRVRKAQAEADAIEAEIRKLKARKDAISIKDGR